MAPKLKILVWESEQAKEEPMLDVTIPVYLAKWIPRMMKFVPRKTREDMWGEDVDLSELNLEELIQQAINSGESEIMQIKARDPQKAKSMLVKIFLEK